ncbi:hypothetical protein [Naasia sp. SYSU D00057]|uniref:hypothetical protein n=1 Tax=Naasia sp. SYSU D00057 TaxID=2817380 RepID=UPI001B3089FE|nr:hypothetical protein [Naasia sp. SYSU D00057]
MILWFTILQIAIAVLAGVLAVAVGLAKKPPSDLTLGGAALVGVLLIAQVVVAIVAPLSGNPPTGNPYEFWAYLISAVILPPVAILWALLERSNWSTVVVGVACLAIAIMLWRMYVIWTIQSA